MVKKYPSYINLSKAEWKKRIDTSWDMMKSCVVCPRKCKVNRSETNVKNLGYCKVKDKAIISSYNPHFGEESCLVGKNGSGTIFLASCNLGCLYCQNFEISHIRLGKEVESDELADIMLELQKMKCHNINFVSPSIYIPQIIKSLAIAVKQGLKIPVIYNTGGYDRVESLKLLDGIIDIYMPDIKYSDERIAKKYSQVPDYWKVVRKAVKEMHRQVGDLNIQDGIAEKGLLIRHLVLPNELSGTKKVMTFLANEISKNTYVNIMDQYHPTYQAFKSERLSRRTSDREFQEAIENAEKVGLKNFDL